MIEQRVNYIKIVKKDGTVHYMPASNSKFWQSYNNMLRGTNPDEQYMLDRKKVDIIDVTDEEYHSAHPLPAPTIVEAPRTVPTVTETEASLLLDRINKQDEQIKLLLEQLNAKNETVQPVSNPEPETTTLTNENES